MAESPLSDDLALTRFARIIELLAEAQVEFIVVGGIAGILAGTGLSTQDLDILFRIDDENIQRLLKVLEDLDATYYDPLGRQFRPNEEKLKTYRVNLFETKLGRFDALPTLAERWTYDDMLPRSVRYKYGEFEFRALDVEALIETKEAAGRPKDRTALPYLRRIQELSSYPDQLEQMMEILDREDAEKRAREEYERQGGEG